MITPPIRAAVLTSSDRCAGGLTPDLSGPAVSALLMDRLQARIIATACVPDDLSKLEAKFREWSRPESGIDLIVSTGGTGLSPRDVTPEAALRIIDRPHPGLMELARARTGSASPKAYLSRGIAGAAAHTLILTLPGSPKGATEQLEALLDLLPHAIQLLRGECTDHGLPPPLPS